MENKDPYNELPTLETGCLRLRSIHHEDAADIFEYAADPRVTEFLPWLPHESIEDTHDFIATTLNRQEWPDLAPWGIEHKADGKLIGSCGFHHWRLEHARAELGYVLAQRYWGQGYMTEAVCAVIDYGFDAMLLNRIEALCRVPNLASARVLEKVGMKFEGILRQYMFAKGAYYDYKIYALLREDYATGDST
jgi:ribosomal-protein-alanine N-acetyltransferase